MDEAKRDALARAKGRLDRHAGLYPRPVSLRGVRIWIVPWLFRLPWFRRFDGYSAHWTILLRSRTLLADSGLVAHELCHVWQMQHHPLRMPLSYLVAGYDANPYEREARRAAAPRVLVFLHGTAIMHPDPAALADFDRYVPTPGAVDRIRGWADAGCEIAYLSSHRDAAGVAADTAVLVRHGFPRGPVLFRVGGESYGHVAASWLPDAIVEDDCASIGREEMTHPQLPPGLQARIRSYVVPEFEGLAGLPARLD